jgi:hypothetical protein|tara:strand:- start:227 stop:2209 length:1983 start_codon:yes stop_codon:yes gene_type:complete
MAKKTQEGLLGEVVQLLRKQNQLSTRDRLKEAEETKRQQKMDEDSLNPATDDRGQVQITDGMDFARRYKANIAGKVTKSKMDQPKEKGKKKVQEVIKHSTFMTRRLIEKANKMMFRINIENTNRDLHQMSLDAKKHKEKMRNDDEYAREHGGEMFDFTKSFRKMIAGFLSPRELARQKKREEWSIIKENWFKYGVVPLIAALTVSIGLAYEGIHFWHVKVFAALKSVKLWATGKWFKPGNFLDSKYRALRTSIYGWFGYDKAGRPMEKKVGGKWTTFGWAGMVDGVKARLANIRMKAFNAIGLGVDGKPIARQSGPRGGVITRAAWTSAGYIGLVTRRIGKIFAPVTAISGGIAKWTGGAIFKGIAKTLKSFMNLGAVKFLGRLLWPVTAIFSIFEGFKAGKTESEREGSKWYTVFGEAIGGVMGYLVGGLADAIKGIVVWSIKKMFGFKSDKDGNIIAGQGMGGDALKAIDEFSFADLVRKIVAFPYHAISAVADFIGKLFSDPVGASKGLWEWISDMPRRIGNWFKGMIPEKVRKFFGIEFNEYDVKGQGLESNNISDAAKKYYTSGEYRKRNNIAKGTKLPGLQDQLDGQMMNADNIQKLRNLEALETRTQRQLDISNGAIDPTTSRSYGHVANITYQYKDEGYGDYLRHARLENAM